MGWPVVVQGRHALPAVLPVKIDTITVSSLQFASALIIVGTAVFGGAVWATKVTMQLTAIQSDLVEIKADMKRLKEADIQHDRHFDTLDRDCCVKRTGSLWLPCIIPEKRRFVLPLQRPAVV